MRMIHKNFYTLNEAASRDIIDQLIIEVKNNSWTLLGYLLEWCLPKITSIELESKLEILS